MYKIDTHLHGKYSSDSIMTYDELCQKAIKNNYKVLAITEHYDLIDNELIEYGLLPLKRYYNELEVLKIKYPQLEIITGLEIGEPHLTIDFAKRLFYEYPPDYIIGSLHVTRAGQNISKYKRNVSLMIDKPMSKDDVKQYYLENLEMVQKGGFDTLGHLGIYKRGLKDVNTIDEHHVYYIIDEIFREMIKKNICL